MSKQLPGEKSGTVKVLTAEVEIRIPFYDLDPLGVVWHGNYYKYFEQARAAFMKGIGFDVEEMKASGYAWPVTKSHCAYVSPLRYDMQVIVRAELEEEAHRLTLRYIVTEKGTAKVLAKGCTEQVAVRMENWEMCLITPEPLLKCLAEARKSRGL
jgi:acyl-CoA thioester hydrolase